MSWMRGEPELTLRTSVPRQAEKLMARRVGEAITRLQEEARQRLGRRRGDACCEIEILDGEQGTTLVCRVYVPADALTPGTDAGPPRSWRTRL